jgi:hypothetical protein
MTIEEEILKHDPTGSFTKKEIMGLMTIMNMPVTVWADAVRSGRASREQLDEWTQALDAIEPGYGKLFLGSMLESEEEQLSKSAGGRAINYVRGSNGEYRPYYKDERGNKVFVGEPQPPAEPPAEPPTQSLVSSCAEGAPRTMEQLEAWKKLKDAEYEYWKTVVGQTKDEAC